MLSTPAVRVGKPTDAERRKLQPVVQGGLTLWVDPLLQPDDGEDALVLRLRRLLWLFPYLDLVARDVSAL